MRILWRASCVKALPECRVAASQRAGKKPFNMATYYAGLVLAKRLKILGVETDRDLFDLVN